MTDETSWQMKIMADEIHARWDFITIETSWQMRLHDNWDFMTDKNLLPLWLLKNWDFMTIVALCDHRTLCRGGWTLFRGHTMMYWATNTVLWPQQYPEATEHFTVATDCVVATEKGSVATENCFVSRNMWPLCSVATEHCSAATGRCVVATRHS